MWGRTRFFIERNKITSLFIAFGTGGVIVSRIFFRDKFFPSLLHFTASLDSLPMEFAAANTYRGQDGKDNRRRGDEQ
jgi:hypothetical protein